MEVFQGAVVLIYQEGKHVVVTVSAPKPWPTHIIPTRQRWQVLVGPKGERRRLGNQGGFVWGDRNKQIEQDLVTFEERMESSPYGKAEPMLTKNDKSVQELLATRNSEDVSSYAPFPRNHYRR